MDTTPSDVLAELDEELNARGISLVFAELKDPVRRKIERYGLTRTINPRHFYPTITAAVTAFRDETGTQWTATRTPAEGRSVPGRHLAADSGPPDIPAAPPVGYSQVPYKPLALPDVTLPKRQRAGSYTEPDLPLRHIPAPF